MCKFTVHQTSGLCCSVELCLQLSVLPVLPRPVRETRDRSKAMQFHSARSSKAAAPVGQHEALM